MRPPKAGGVALLCVLGGRDSALAAIRLRNCGIRMTLVTICSDHLMGVEAVRKRLLELRSLLPNDTEWLLVQQPHQLFTDTAFYAPTCLPCQHSYVISGVAIAQSLGERDLAIGYTSYQSTWPEQTPYAIHRLNSVLGKYGINLRLPVYDIKDKQYAINELIASGLSPISLEQKCVRQTSNITLTSAALESQIDLWAAAIDNSISRIGNIAISVRERSCAELANSPVPSPNNQ